MIVLPAFAALLVLIGHGPTQVVGLGELCDATLTCPGANTYCSTRVGCSMGSCKCSPGSAYDYLFSKPPECVTEKLIGDSCTSYCTVGTCIDGTCACSSTQTVSSDRRSCLGIIKNLGDTCSSSSECTYYGICNTTCQCPTGYKQVSEKYCSFYDEGDACTPGITKCGNQASCISGTCQCNTVDGVKYEWYVFTNLPLYNASCFHPSATRNSGFGEPCTSGVWDATAKSCSLDLQCAICPEDRGTKNTKCLILGS